MPPTLLIFDVDGTLTRTVEADGLSVLPAFERAFGFPMTHTGNWEAYPHVTDTAIPDWEMRERYGRAPTAEEIESFALILEEELQTLHRRRPELFQPVQGASQGLQQVRERQEFYSVIATGCVERSARFKLTVAGLDIDGLPASFADRHVSREAIVLAAIDEAEKTYGMHFERRISIGDGAWDLRTARALDLLFVGVDAEADGRLKVAGADPVVEHLGDLTDVIDRLVGS